MASIKPPLVRLRLGTNNVTLKAWLKETSYLSLDLHSRKEQRPSGTATSLSSTISAKSNRVNYVFFIHMGT